jgi:hypothetical protein
MFTTVRHDNSGMFICTKAVFDIHIIKYDPNDVCMNVIGYLGFSHDKALDQWEGRIQATRRGGRRKGFQAHPAAATLAK